MLAQLFLSFIPKRLTNCQVVCFLSDYTKMHALAVCVCAVLQQVFDKLSHNASGAADYCQSSVDKARQAYGL